MKTSNKLIILALGIFLISLMAYDVEIKEEYSKKKPEKVNLNQFRHNKFKSSKKYQMDTLGH